MPRWSTTSISDFEESIWHSKLARFPAFIVADDKADESSPAPRDECVTRRRRLRRVGGTARRRETGAEGARA